MIAAPLLALVLAAPLALLVTDAGRTNAPVEAFALDPRWLEATRPDAARPDEPAGPYLALRDGDRWPGTVERVDESGATLAGAKIPLARVDAVWLGAIRPAVRETGPRRADVALLANGDRLAGTLVSLDRFSGEVRVRVGDETRVLPLAQVAGILFNNALTRPRKPPATFTLVYTTDGGRRSLTGASATADAVAGTPVAGGPKWSAPWASVAAVRNVPGPGIDWLTLKPTRVVETPFLDLPRPATIGRTAAGDPLRLRRADGRSDSFDMGIALRPDGSRALTLGGRYRRFVARVGVSDDGQPGREWADCRLKILADGRDVTPADCARLRAGEPGRRLAVELAGVQELTVAVECGERGPAGDEVVIAEGWLIE